MLSYFITGPFLYISIIVCVSAVAYKVLSYQKMPRHLRWDLYPVPHQGPEGSKYQKVDFYKKPAVFSKPHEMIAMSQEMIFIKKAFVHNRRLWVGTWPLHMGIYLSGVWLALLVVGAIFGIQGETVNISTNILAWGIAKLTVIVGAAAFIMGLFGSLVLLWLRYSDDDLRYIADLVTYFNLYLMAALFLSGLLAWTMVDPFFDVIRNHVAALMTFQGSSVNEPLVVLEILVFGIFLLYLPFSRMMHFAAKYFFYHNIMWDDEAMVPHSALEQDIQKSLQYKLRWSSGHIVTGKAWTEQEGEQTKEGEKQHEKTSSH
ncbi:hypothetical protein SDC9_13613 [bioreactor metagenome]|uniref:NarG-like domain-containing protein n=1 Tax=bioreactor metagenome TaxID=1076179 RepID=A0A644TLW0_9ZZZZ|nr:hypothetical protein [Negativicutes bacterium]